MPGGNYVRIAMHLTSVLSALTFSFYILIFYVLIFLVQ